ncbi:Ig-like domain-containing protein [Enterobacter oligotrophicus]|uniref:Ig-like domain-containing protein n=1 Tax=Enterobacter TaxID=547 RepID=UPI001C0177D1|nr:Ig-like domain-containing protein [Enterobacter oligotrophicus]ELW1647858.1 Ig-like domain-containing protein [Enterobacter oligotrophicus]MBT9426196.1 Ig-like domain-containing protein [Enterobacter oligotrophicus]
MRFYAKITACLQIFLQLIIIFINSFVFSIPAIASSRQTPSSQTTAAASTSTAKEDDAGKNLANVLSSTGSMLSQDNKTDALINSAINNSSAYATNEIQSWLEQFGTARINLGFDNNLSLESANLDMLLPLYDDKKQNLIFTQLGTRRDDDRNIINAGLGYRYFADTWMWGVNAFYDQQLSDNTHQRLGLGAELGWDYFRLSANGYQRLSGWKDSKDHKDYEERVANGYDVRAEGYLPAYPQLGAQLIWEQYYGDDVALFGDNDDDRQRDPYAVTAGINYTPVPLFSVGLNQKMGKGDHNDTQVELALNWMLGSPLSAQLDADKVKDRRTLLGSRLDLVNRNNTIVLEYRKKELISLKLPAKISGIEAETVPFNVNVKSKYPVDHITWQDDSLVQSGGKIDEKNGTWTVTLPRYQQNGAEKNMYVVSATAYDNQGNKSDVSHMTVAVSGFNLADVTTTTSAASASLPADGTSTTQITVTVTSGSGEKITGLAGSLSAQLSRSAQSQKVSASPVQEKISSFKEQTPGVYVSTFTAGTLPGAVVVQPLYNQTTKLSNTTVILTAVSDTSHFATLDASKTSALANAQDAIPLKAHVVDAMNNPVQGMAVHWSSENGDALLAATTSTTDAQGYAVNSLTSSKVITTTVSAQLDNGEAIQSKALQFTADTRSAHVTQINADKKIAQADNQDQITVSAMVTDASQHPLVNQPVDWAIDTASGTARLADKQSNTDENGIATVTLKSTKSGQGIVSASTGSSDALKTDVLTFLPDVKTATLGSVSATKTSALANGHDPVTFKVKVEDANKNPLKGVKINWSTASAQASLSGTSTSTDAKGEATVDLTSTTVENTSVTATLGEQSQTSPAINFIADNATAFVQTLDTDKTQAVANQNDRISLTAQVIDANDHPVSDSAVQWKIVEGQGTLSAAQNNTNAQGDATVTLVSSMQGKVVVSASAAAGAAVNSQKLTFTADTATAKVTNVAVDKSAAIANGKDKITYTATVTDAKGNPVKDQNVNWTASPSTAKLSTATTKTDVNGTASVTVTTVKAGEVNVTAQAGSGAAWNAPATRFTGDVTTAQIENIKASKNTAVANGTDSITFTGTVIDANNNILTGVEAAWTVNPTTGALSASKSTSNDAGKVSVSLTSTQVESYAVTVKVNGTDETSETVNFTVDESTAGIHSLTADKTDNIAAGRDNVTLTATVQDAAGHPIPNATVTWSSDNTTGLFSETSVTTDAEGKAIATFSGTLAQATTVTASSVNNSQKTVQLTLVPDMLSAKPVTITSPGYDYDAIADGKDVIALTATVKDDYGNAINQGDVNWKVIPAGNYHLSANTQATNAQGKSTVTIASEDVVACKAVATFNNVSLTSGTMRFIADVTTETVTDLTASKTTDIVAGKDVITLQATVKDASGNPVNNETVHWGTDNPGGTFQPSDSSNTDTNGVASVSYTATKAGPTVIGAGINHSQQTVIVNIIGNVETAALSNIKADKTKAVADNTELVTWSVTAKDANGNILPGTVINWSSDDPDLTLAASSSTTNEQGIATITGRTMKARDVIVSATIPGNGQTLKATKVTFIGDIKTASLLSLTPDKTTALSNGSDSVTYTVDVEDVNHNTVPDAVVAWQTTMNHLSAATTKTNSSGVATVKLSGSDQGIVTVTATINTSTLEENSVKFINTIEDTWVITTDSSSYTSAPIKGYSDLGFITSSPTTGPTSLDWAPSGASQVSTPVTLVDDSGQQYEVQLKGYRLSDCSQRPLNAAVGCSGQGGYRAKFTWNISDNPDIPPGHYTGLIHFAGKDWHTDWAFEYRLTMDLTIN